MVFIGIINFLWVSKYLVSTGCLIFPLDFTCINFEWSISKIWLKEFQKKQVRLLDLKIILTQIIQIMITI